MSFIQQYANYSNATNVMMLITTLRSYTLHFELEQDESYSWGTPFNRIFVIDWCPNLTDVQETRKEMEMLVVTMQPSTVNTCKELLQNPLVNSSHESMSGLSDEPLQECLNELL